MNLLAKIIRSSSATTPLFLNLSHSRLFAVYSTSTETFEQSIILKKSAIHYYLFSIYKEDKKQQRQQQNQYEYLLVDIKGQNSNVALVQLNRPKTFNSLCDGLTKEV